MGGHVGTVSAVTVYKIVSLGFKPQCALEFFSPLYPFRPALGPTQPPLQIDTGALRDKVDGAWH